MKPVVLFLSLSLAACGADSNSNQGTTAADVTQKQGVISAYSADLNVAGVVAYSHLSYAGYFESSGGDGVRGVSINNDGGKFSTQSRHHGAVRVENSRGPQIVFSGEMTNALPLDAPQGSLMVVKNGDRMRLAFSPEAGEWEYVTD
ncbi:MAG: hypothetical protein MK185_06535 [Saccharospirillaceae bacterium]|nr:hypothetical protein [Saccharospirillaceae bacterium]